MEVRELRVLQETVERRPAGPLDEHERLPRRLAADLRRMRRMRAQRDHAPLVRLDRIQRPAGVGEVVLVVGQIEQVQSVQGHRRRSIPLAVRVPVRSPAR